MYLKSPDNAGSTIIGFLTWDLVASGIYIYSGPDCLGPVTGDVPIGQPAGVFPVAITHEQSGGYVQRQQRWK